MPTTNTEKSSRLTAVIAAVAVGLGLLWAYWPLLLGMAEQWEDSPEYSHGWLVPPIALALLWMRRPQEHSTPWTKVGLATLLAGIGLGFLAPANLTWVAGALGVAGAAIMWSDWAGPDEGQPDWLGGLLLLAGGVAFQLISAHFYLEWFERLALVPVLAGCLLLLKGRPTFRWSWPAIGFLFFMVPLPHTLEVALRSPLRRVGTLAATYAMQTLGLPAFSEGNVIIVDDVRIGVVEACSGLRMMMIFFALSAAVALLIERPVWQKSLILVSAVPIALVSNIIRLTVTAVFYSQGWEHLADLTFHDLAGWLMMPLGLGLLWCELWFLDHLYVVQEDRPMSTGLQVRQVPAEPKAMDRPVEMLES